MSRSKPVVLILAAACAAVLSACATAPRSAAAPPAPAPVAAGDVIEQDRAYVQRVEQLARRRGIGVTWVNPPVKRRVATR